MPFDTTRRVEWGDCDAAGIIYYPNYFRMMDSVFHEMCREVGLSQRSMSDHGVFGTPLIDVGAQFASPVTYGDVLDVQARITRLGNSGLSLEYRFARDGAKAARGHEHRVCVRQTSDGIEKAPLPASMRALLERFSEG